MEIITKIVLPVLTLLLSGGALVTVITLKAKKDEATANTDKVEMDNFRTGTDLLMKQIVDPLKAELANVRRELDETRKELRSVKYQCERLRKALDKISDCVHAASCPVKAAIKEHGGDKEEE